MSGSAAQNCDAVDGAAADLGDRCPVRLERGLAPPGGPEEARLPATEEPLVDEQEVEVRGDARLTAGEAESRSDLGRLHFRLERPGDRLAAELRNRPKERSGTAEVAVSLDSRR